eukprot:g18898.t1
MSTEALARQFPEPLNDVYRVEAFVGQGAFSTVWRATHRTSGQVRAIKKIDTTDLNAYECGDGEHCCCMFGCIYDVEKDACSGCDPSDPLVAKFHIPASHLWRTCNIKNSLDLGHKCGSACCCNAGYQWGLESRRCEETKDLAELPKSLPQRQVPQEDLVPGSQTWIEAGLTCESRTEGVEPNAYSCSDGRHCCCRFGCLFNAEQDSCTACRDDTPEGSCTPEHSHVCGKSCCCHGQYRWDLEQRHCVRAGVVKAPRRIGVLTPPKPAPSLWQPVAFIYLIAGSQTWLSCEAKNAYVCGSNHCCCMFGCEYNLERDACSSCNDKDPLEKNCDASNSHRCGQSCCCNGDYVWDMELRRCTQAAQADETTTESYASPAEEAARYRLFIETKARVDILNKLNGEPVFGITWLADRYDEEKYDIELSPQQITSCAPSTGTYGCQGCNGGFTEGAYDYLKTAPGLANSFYIPYEQSLTESTETASCPKSKVDAMSGPYMELSGGYAQFSGYSYAIPPCTEGSCENQERDLKGLASALEEAPVSVCVNAGDKNTCGLADDVTIPHVKVDLSKEEAAEAAMRREAMFQRASTWAENTLEVQIAIMRFLRHENVVRCYDVFLENQFVSVVMDLFNGGDLVDGLNLHRRASGRLRNKQLRHLAKQMTAAVAHVHSLEIMHRDVKGENFLSDRPNIADPHVRV